MDNNVVEKLKEILLGKLNNVEAIVLFGSYSRGKEKFDSDIDVAIKLSKPLEKENIISLKNKIEEILGIDVHLIDLYSINEDFRYEILISGKTLYCKNEYEFEMYKLKCFSEYLMFSEDRKPIIDKVKNGGTLYGK